MTPPVTPRYRKGQIVLVKMVVVDSDVLSGWIGVRHTYDKDHHFKSVRQQNVRPLRRRRKG